MTKDFLCFVYRDIDACKPLLDTEGKRRVCVWGGEWGTCAHERGKGGEWRENERERECVCVIIIIIIDHFYIALFSAFEQTHCTRMRFYMSE